MDVTQADLEVIANEIESDYRYTADDPYSDYEATCEHTGEGEASCTIQPYYKGDQLASYTRKSRFCAGDVAGVPRGHA